MTAPRDRYSVRYAIYDATLDITKRLASVVPTRPHKVWRMGEPLAPEPRRTHAGIRVDVLDHHDADMVRSDRRVPS